MKSAAERSAEGNAGAGGHRFRMELRRVVRRSRAAHLLRWGWVAGGGAAVAGAMTVAGFNWLQGVSPMTTRYYQGVAADRP